MKLLPALTLCLFVLASVTFAQDFKQKTKKFRNAKRFSTQYDKFKDITVVRVGWFSVSGTKEYLATSTMLFIGAAFFHRGATLSTNVEQFAIEFNSTSKDWQFLQHRDVIVLADGERIPLGEASREGKVSRGFGGVEVTEFMRVMATPEQLEKIANAKKVEIQIGRRELELKGEQLEAFRDLMSLAEIEEPKGDKP